MRTDIKNDRVIYLILNKLKAEERKLKWLSRKSGINYNSLYAIFYLKTTQLSEERLKVINKVLKTKFKK